MSHLCHIDLVIGFGRSNGDTLLVMPGHSSLNYAGCVNLSAMPRIHVFLVQPAGEVKTWMAGHRRAEATPSFGRLCSAMTIGSLRIRHPRQRFLDETCGLQRSMLN